MSTYTITVVGVGGVGGLLTGVIGRVYTLGLTLIARGVFKDKLLKEGLTLKSDFYGDAKVMPFYVADTVHGMPKQDIIFITVKNYSLDEVIEQIRPIVGEQTILCPIMNGVEASDILREAFSKAIVLDANIYTLSERTDGIILQKGNFTHIFIGSKIPAQREKEAAQILTQVLKDGGFDARYSEDIERKIWEKFILNCGFNSVTARHLMNIEDIKKEEKLSGEMYHLMLEAQHVGEALGVTLAPDTAKKKYLYMIQEQADGSTSSMRRDIQNHQQTELEAFLGFITKKAKEVGVEVPVSDMYYKELKEIQKGDYLL